MTGQGGQGPVRSIVLAGLTAALACGCQGWRAGWAAERKTGSPPAAPSSATADSAPAPAEKDSPSVALVEDFLARTRDYDASAASPRSSVPKPASGAEDRIGERAEAPGAALAASESAPASVLPAAPVRDRAVANAQVTLSDGAARPSPAAPVVKSLSLRAPPTVLGTAVEPARTNATNQPLDVHAGEADASPDRLLAVLESRARAGGGWDGEWSWRLGQLAFGASVAAEEVGPSLAPAERSLMAGVVGLVAAVPAAAKAPGPALETALTQAEALHRLLAERADPVLAAVALCRKVVTFGVFEEMAPDDLVAGRSTPSIVYCEIRNLSAERTAEGDYRTRLATRLELLTAAGESIWRHEEPEIVDTCRRRRTDFFIAQRITLPATLAAGEHVLKVTVEDLQSGRVNEALHRFTVAATGAVARGG